MAKVEHDDSRRNPSLQAIVVTQHTCFAVLGVSRRWFLDYLHSHAEVPRAQLGRNTCVLVSDWIAHVRARMTDGESTPDPPEDEWTPEALLARRGLRRTG